MILPAMKNHLAAHLSRMDFGWILILSSYVLFYGMILVNSDGLPYIFENNESFSAFFHAKNFLTYGPSSGLVDESNSPDPSAHPFVYTHTGSSPRFIALLFYVLGLKTIETQIIASTATVGILGIYFCYKYFVITSDRLFATIYCLFLLSDYILFSQWNVNTWQNLKTPLLFGGLLAAINLVNVCSKKNFMGVAGFHAILFYYEHIFNIYVAISIFITFFLYSVRRSAQSVAFFLLAQVLGVLFSVAVLLSQNINQLGWETTRGDIYYAFIGRNYSADPALLNDALRFYSNHNIAFFMSFIDGSKFRNIDFLKQLLFQDSAVHTPLFSLVVFLLIAAFCIKLFSEKVYLSSRVFSALIYVLLFITIMASIISMISVPLSGVGVSLKQNVDLIEFLNGFSGVFIQFIFIICVIVLLFGNLSLTFSSHRKLVGVFLFSLISYCLINNHMNLYKSTWFLYWLTVIGNNKIQKEIMLLIVTFLSSYLIIYSSKISDILFKHIYSEFFFKNLLIFYFPLFLLFFIFTGNVYANNIVRMAPFSIYATTFIVSFAVWIPVKLTVELFTNIYKCRFSLSSCVLYSCYPLLATFILFYWVNMQSFLIRYFPPDSYSFMKKLSEPPYKGKSFVTNIYPLPVAYHAGGWAYWDPGFLNGEQYENSGRRKLMRDFSMLWFADRKENMDYLYPNYFLYMSPINFDRIIDRILHDNKINTKEYSYRNVGFITQANNNLLETLKAKEVMADKSGYDGWAVFELDWNKN